MTWLLNAFGGGAGGNAYTTYASSASFTTSAGAGLVLSSSELALFDFGSGGCAPSLLRGGSFGGTGTSRDALAITVHARSMRGRMLAPVRAAASGGRAVGDFPAADPPEGAGTEGAASRPSRSRCAARGALAHGPAVAVAEWTDDGGPRRAGCAKPRAYLTPYSDSIQQDFTSPTSYSTCAAGGSNKVWSRWFGRLVPLQPWLQDWVGKRRPAIGCGGTGFG